jgi:hypothetical protein
MDDPYMNEKERGMQIKLHEKAITSEIRWKRIKLKENDIRILNLD